VRAKAGAAQARATKTMKAIMIETDVVSRKAGRFYSRKIIYQTKGLSLEYF